MPGRKATPESPCSRRGLANCSTSPQAPGGSCNDEGMPLICPTRQVLAQSVLAGDRRLTLHGVVFDIFAGSQSDAAEPLKSCPKPHTPARLLLQRKWRA